MREAVAQMKAETREALVRLRHTQWELKRKEGQTRACLWCAKAVRSVGRGRPALYCSKECRTAGRRIYQTAYKRKYRAQARERGTL